MENGKENFASQQLNRSRWQLVAGNLLPVGQQIGTQNPDLVAGRRKGARG